MNTLTKLIQGNFLQNDTYKIINSALNNIDDLKSALIFIITNVKVVTKCEAIGIRLLDNGDYPYFVQDGFPQSFILKENSLCATDENGNKVRTQDGQGYLLECMCGNVIRGNTNPDFSFFTEYGSFFSNNTTSLLKSNTKIELQGETRNYCNFCGYESVALIPIKSKNKIIGLIQLNDTRIGMFTEEIINYLQILGENFGLAIENCYLNSKIKETEEIIRINAKKEKMAEDFLVNIAHELKTPITVMYSAIQTMECICKDELSEKAKGLLDKMKTNTNRQLKFVNNFMDISRIKEGYIKTNKRNLDIVLLTRTITESISIFAQQKGIHLQFYSTIKKKIIGIDDEKFERIILNLLSNAVKFTPKGKLITVKVSLKIVNRKCKVYVQIRDEGIGIPQDKQEIIFERFGQVDSSLSRQAEGTGIGLSLVKVLVESLEGEIKLESKKGIGSTFSIILPSKKVKETTIQKNVREISEARLAQGIEIEFSDIY